MNGNVTKEGITADLQWMKRVGIGGLQNFDAALGTPQVVDKRLVFMTPEWKDAFHHAASLAADLDLELAIATSPGWSQTGGPWVRPEQAMKKVVWSTTLIEGGRRYDRPLAQPPAVAGPFQDLRSDSRGPNAAPDFYVDTEVIAFRTPADEIASRSVVPQVTTTSGPLDARVLSDGSLTRTADVPVQQDGTGWIQFTYQKPTRVQSVTLVVPVRHGFGAPPQFDAILQASDEGAQFRDVVALAPSLADQRTVSFPPVVAKTFRVVFRATRPFARQMADGVIPMQFPPSPPTISVAELTLHSRMLVNRFVEKAGFAAAPDYYAIDSAPAPSASVVARDGIVNLTSRLTRAGHLDWTPPPGKWVVLRFGYSLTGHMNGPASAEATGLEVDKLDPLHVREYLTRYFAMYESATGKDLIGARGLRALLSDSYEAGAQNWTENMLAEFARRRGYDARPWLPALAGWIVESSAASDRFLWDYRRTIAELLSEAHYGQVKAVAHERGLTLYGEALEDQRPALGDDLAMRRSADIPMAAMWTWPGRDGPDPTYIADDRGAASVAHVHGQNIAAAESFTAFGYPWAFAPRDLQPVADLEFALGINRIVIHTSAHQPLMDRRPGMSLSPLLGQYFSRTETWAEQAGPWIDYLARSSYLLQQGRFVADVAYFYGQEAPITGLYGKPGAGLQPADQPQGFGFDFVNDDVVLNEFNVEDGQLVTPSGMRYRILYLGGSSERMTLPVLRKLDALVGAGAKVVGVRPKESPSLSDDPTEFRRAAAALTVRQQTPNEALAQLRVSPDFEFRGGGDTDPPQILFLHRALADADIYFVSNRTNRKLSGDGVFRMKGRAPEAWDAESGRITDLSYRSEDGRTVVPLELPPQRSMFIVFRGSVSAPSRTVPPTHESVVSEIQGPWTLKFSDKAAAGKLGSWTESNDPAIRYFSGTATYSTTFEAPRVSRGDHLLLELGDVRELATVRINGTTVRTLWRPPFRVDITDAIRRGSNRVEIDVTNLWVNRLIGDAQPGAQPHTFTTGPTYSAQAPLRPSGLLGPVRVLRLSMPDR
jgi:hypothetical protein